MNSNCNSPHTLLMDDVKPGKYQHYKGQLYEVVGVARHSETLEELVVYRALSESTESGSQAIWVRPKSMFQEYVTIAGETVPRFKYVEL